MSKNKKKNYIGLVIGIVIAAVLVAAVNFVQNKKRRRK